MYGELLTVCHGQSWHQKSRQEGREELHDGQIGLMAVGDGIWIVNLVQLWEDMDLVL